MGLIGGLKTINKEFHLVWGAWPRNDQKLMIIDEMSNLKSDIERTSRVRSSGLAELDKGGIRSKALARTRLLCLTNTMLGKNLEDYPTGIIAMLDVFNQKLEDIRRFDLVLTTDKDEVSAEEINVLNQNVEDNRYTVDLIRSGVRFAWALKPKDIQLSDEAVKRCLAYAITLSKEYHSSIPLILPADAREKLARIAVAIAIQTFNYQHGKIRVEPVHVDVAYNILTRLYNKPSLAFAQYSKLKQIQEQALTEETLLKALTDGEGNKPEAPQLKAFYLACSTTNTIDEITLQAALELESPFRLNLIVRQLINAKAIEKGKGFRTWVVTLPLSKLCKQKQVAFLAELK